MEEMGGPYLSIAVFCEKLLQESDGGLSLIRVFDRYTVAEPSESIPITTIPLTLVILMRSGIFRGPSTINVVGYSPSGQEIANIPIPTLFEGDNERGALLA